MKDTMYCPYCGAELPENDDCDFCIMCGRKLPKMEGSESVCPSMQTSESHLISIFPVLSLIFGGISLLFALLGSQFGVLGFFGMGIGFFQVGDNKKYRWMSIAGITMSVVALVIFCYRLWAVHQI